MKKLGIFKNSLLMSAVALSILSSPANAVSEENVRVYLQENKISLIGLSPQTMDKLKALSDTTWKTFQKTFSMVSHANPGLNPAELIARLAKVNIAGLQTVDAETWGKLFNVSDKLTQNIAELDRDQVFDALSSIDSRLILHPAFSEGVTIFLHMLSGDRAQAIREIGKHLDIFRTKTISYHTLVKRLNAADSSIAHSDIVKNLSSLHNQIVDNPNFLTQAYSLMQLVDVNSYAMVITALGKIYAKNWEAFVNISRLLTKSMDREERIKLISSLSKISFSKISCVHVAITSLMDETKEKIQLRQQNTAMELIKALEGYTTDESISLYIKDLIAQVNGTTKEAVNDDLLKDFMNKAWGRVYWGDDYDKLASLGRSKNAEAQAGDNHEKVTSQPRGLGAGTREEKDTPS